MINEDNVLLGFVIQLDQQFPVGLALSFYFMKRCQKESKGGKKRLYTHLYSSRGAGVKIETAIPDKGLNSMRLFVCNLK